MSGKGTEGNLELSFVRSRNASDITYLVLGSDDLVNWETVHYDSEATPYAGGDALMDEVVVSIPAPSSPWFLRLQVVKAD